MCQPRSQHLQNTKKLWFKIHLSRVDPLSNRPRRHDVVHDAITESLGHVVESQELPDAGQSVVVSVGVGVHLLNDGGDVAEDASVQQRWQRKKK